MTMTTLTIAPASVQQVIPYSLLEEERKPKFGNRKVEKFLTAASQALLENHPDNISLVVAIAPGKMRSESPWTRRYKPESITIQTFYHEGNSFGAIEILAKILGKAYGENNIFAMIDPHLTPQDFRLLSAEIRGDLANSGCLLYSN
jgi:hypothetical protein